MKINQAFAVVVAVLTIGVSAPAQRNFASGSPVSENFDTLGTATLLVTDNTTIQGFYTRKSADVDGNLIANSVIAGTGIIAISDLYHFGVAGTNPLSDRAFGGIPGGAGVVNISCGLRLVNSGSVPITSISVGYTGEHWRDQNGVNIVSFDYRVSSTAITDLTTGTYTAVAGLTYSPSNPSGTGLLDGNAPANRQVFTAITISLVSTPLLPGNEIMLRWTMGDSSGPDHGIAVDDIAVTVVTTTAADATISGRVFDSYGRAISSALISVQDFSGNRKLTYTNTFGYYSVPGLESGESYIVSVSARRYTFATSSYVIDLGDSVTGINFVATR